MISLLPSESKISFINNSVSLVKGSDTSATTSGKVSTSLDKPKFLPLLIGRTIIALLNLGLAAILTISDTESVKTFPFPNTLIFCIINFTRFYHHFYAFT